MEGRTSHHPTGKSTALPLPVVVIRIWCGIPEHEVGLPIGSTINIFKGAIVRMLLVAC